MPAEIERKFLVLNELWKQKVVSKFQIVQAYLSIDPERTVRVRIKGDKAYLTVKGKNQGIKRVEFEYDIPVAEAEQMIQELSLRPILEKVRYLVQDQGGNWEVDVFSGENQGLIIAEIELRNEAEKVELPNWIGKDVSDDSRYFNSNLIKTPYCSW